MKRSIILLFVQITLSTSGQIHNGNYIQIPQVYVDGSISYEISNDSIIRREYSIAGIDSTIGLYKIEQNILYLEWFKNSNDKETICLFLNPSQISSSDKIIINVKDTRDNPIPGVNIISCPVLPTHSTSLIGLTDGAGQFMIDINSLNKPIKFSCAGYTSSQLNIDSKAILSLDSVVIYLNHNHKKYQERKNDAFQIISINDNGFVLIEHENQPTKYLNSMVLDTLVKEGQILRKAYYTKEEYQQILDL
jgi:hypothetical protein